MRLQIKLLVCISLVGCSILAVVGQDKKPLKAIYDKARNETRVDLSEPFRVAALPQGDLGRSVAFPDEGEWIDKPEDLHLTVYFKQAGNAPRVPEKVTWNVYARAFRKKRFEKERRLVIIADGKKFEYGEMDLIDSHRDQSDTGVGDIYFREFLEAQIPLQDYAEIVRSQSVQAQVGTVRFSFLKNDLKMLKSYVDRLLR